MHHFVDDDVIEALARFFGQVGVEANAGGRDVATAPAGSHALDEKTVDFDAEDGFPAGDER